MNETVNLITELIINLFQGAAFTLFCNFFFTPKFRKGVNIAICTGVTLLLFGVITIVNLTTPTIAFIEVILYLIIMLPFSIFCHEGKLSLKIIMPLLIFVLLMGIGVGYSTFLSLAIDKEVQQILAFSSTYHVIYCTITNATYGFLLYLVCRIYKQKIDLRKPVDIVSFIIIPLLTLVTVVIITALITDIHITETSRLLLGIIAVIAFVIAFVMFALMKEISKAAEVNALNLVMTREQEIYKSEIDAKNAYIEEVSVIKHEMKRKLYYISELINEGKTHQAYKACRDADNEISELSTVFKTNNLYLNSILNLTLKRASDNQINFIHTIRSNLSLVDGLDLLSLLGNLIDNAFEALENTQGEKLLQITIFEKEHYYIVSVKNTIASHILDSNPELKTTKMDKHAHGHGLKIVKNILSKYHGDISFNEVFPYFTANVLIEKPNTSPTHSAKKHTHAN